MLQPLLLDLTIPLLTSAVVQSRYGETQIRHSAWRLSPFDFTGVVLVVWSIMPRYYLLLQVTSCPLWISLLNVDSYMPASGMTISVHRSEKGTILFTFQGLGGTEKCLWVIGQPDCLYSLTRHGECFPWL